MKPSLILHALESLNWQGHVELGGQDLRWIAESLAIILSPNNSTRCDVCNEVKDLTVETRIGRICEDCIEDLTDIAADSRADMED